MRTGVWWMALLASTALGVAGCTSSDPPRLAALDRPATSEDAVPSGS